MSKSLKEELKLMYGRYALAVSIVLLGWAGAAAAQTVVPDPWTRVPDAPTSYYNDDDFVDRVSNASVAVNTDIDKQKKLNAEFNKSFDAMDGMQKAQRMQAYMMKNPQEAMKMMQAMQAAGNTVTAGVSSANTNNTRLEQELATHKTNFSAALDKTLKPLQARQEEMIKTRSQPKGEAGMEFKSAADLAQFTALEALRYE